MDIHITSEDIDALLKDSPTFRTLLENIALKRMLAEAGKPCEKCEAPAGENPE